MERYSLTPSLGILSPRPEQVVVDPDAPHILEFLRREMLLGTIRVVPCGRKRLVILPSSLWFGAGTASHPIESGKQP